MWTAVVRGYHQVNTESSEGGFLLAALMQDILAIKFDIELVKTRNKYFTERK